MDCVVNAPNQLGNMSSSSSSSDQAEKNELKFCFWNVNGLTVEQLNHYITGAFLKKHDMILINDTWSGPDDNFILEGYTFYNYPRLNRNHKAKRNSGGLGIFVSNDVKHGVIIRKHHGDLIAWMVLDSTALGLVTDIHVANVYVPPEDSVHLPINAFETIQNYLYNTGKLWDYYFGDINAHTCTELDYPLSIHGSGGDLDNLLPHDARKSELEN